MADDEQEEKTIAQDLVVTKYKMAADIVNCEWHLSCYFCLILSKLYLLFCRFPAVSMSTICSRDNRGSCLLHNTKKIQRKFSLELSGISDLLLIRSCLASLLCSLYFVVKYMHTLVCYLFNHTVYGQSIRVWYTSPNGAPVWWLDWPHITTGCPSESYPGQHIGIS